MSLGLKPVYTLPCGLTGFSIAWALTVSVITVVRGTVPEDQSSKGGVMWYVRSACDSKLLSQAL